MELAFLYIKENQGIDTEISYPYEAYDGKCRFQSANIGATDRVRIHLMIHDCDFHEKEMI